MRTRYVLRDGTFFTASTVPGLFDSRGSERRAPKLPGFKDGLSRGRLALWRGGLGGGPTGAREKWWVGGAPGAAHVMYPAYKYSFIIIITLYISTDLLCW